MLAAIGVVYGDRHQPPVLAADRVQHRPQRPGADALDVHGITYLIFWAVTVIVSVKYLALVMRADKAARGHPRAHRRALRGPAAKAITILGVVGAGLFYGDSVITPAISVTSAVEGLQVVKPGRALTVHATQGHRLTPLREKPFALLTRNAGGRVEAFHPPPNRPTVLGGTIRI